nr:potassium channel family protein [Chitinophagaceae bacterium]
MQKKVVHIFGSGHLVFRLKKIIESKSYQVVQCNDEVINNISISGSIIDNLESYFKQVDLEHVKMIYLLDDKDENNLQLVIALSALKLNIPITVSLFNENFISNLFKDNPKITILNPAKIAAPHFVEALDKEHERTEEIPSKSVQNSPQKKGDYLILKLLAVFLSVLTCYVLYFHYHEHLNWVNAIYFVVSTMTTVGYGDVNLLNASDWSKMLAVVLMLASTTLMWMIFSLTVDYFLKNRIQISLGRKKYNLKKHIIVCGLGRLGYYIVQELLQKGEKVIIIEIDENSKHIEYFRSRGAAVYVGDARSEKVLADVNVTKSAALISVINNDALNIEIGLHAQALCPHLKIILRIFDEDIAAELKEVLHLNFVISNSSIASKYFYKILEKATGNS